MPSTIQNNLQQDRKSFLLFLILVVVTATNFIFFAGNPVSFGLVAVVWGMFGFFRLVYLTHYQMEDIPKILNLPIQIIFGTGKKEQEKRKLVIKRMARPDVILWLMGAIFFMFWALFNSVSPSKIYMIEGTDAISLMQQFDPYAILTKMSYFGVVVTLVFVSLTYSQKRTHLKWSYYTLSPVLLIGLVGILKGQYVSPVLWPEVSYFRGMGISQSFPDIDILSSELINSNSSFVHRFIELGSVGAYGVYVLFAPAFVMLIKAFVRPNRSYLKPLLGLISLMLLAFIDILVISSVWVSFTSVLLICLASVSWGHTVRYKL